MSAAKKLFKAAVRFYAAIPGLLIPGKLGKRFLAECAEEMVPVDTVRTQYGPIRFYCFGWLPLWRSQTFFTKEPETLEWIDRMDKEDILWDIGANVGIYSIYAGMKGMKVFAFEPSALNTFFISKNIELNGLKERVLLFPVAVSDRNEFGYLNMTSTDVGGALNEFNAGDIQSVHAGEVTRPVVFKQGMFAYSADELIEKYGFELPSYIKIDVDSIEDRIIYGAGDLLSRPEVKGVLLELDETEARTEQLIAFLKERGLVLREKRHSEMFKGSQFETQFNYIFERE